MRGRKGKTFKAKCGNSQRSRAISHRACRFDAAPIERTIVYNCTVCFVGKSLARDLALTRGSKEISKGDGLQGSNAMVESKLVIDKGAAQGGPETSHALMHREHRQWHSENELWRDDIATWQKELKTALADLAQVEKALREHEKALEVHAAAIRCYEQDAAAHEHLLAEFESGGTGDKLVALVQAHQTGADKHAQQRSVHERIKKHHHIVIARCNLLLKALASV
jgi:hypothetical protein